MAGAAEIRKEIERAATNVKNLTSALVAARQENVKLAGALETADKKIKELEGQLKEAQGAVKTGTEELAATNKVAEDALAGQTPPPVS